MEKNAPGLLLFFLILILCGCAQDAPAQENELAPDVNGSEMEASTDFDARGTTETPLGSNNQNNPLRDVITQPQPDANSTDDSNADISEKIEFVEWQYNDSWKPRTEPPQCPEIFIAHSPVDVTLATSVLYPGQERGGDFKPHGGFRFDNSKNNEIVVSAPFEGYVTDGARYFEKGELQYTFDIIHPCGIMYRFDHLRELSPEFLKLAEQFREPVEGDSRGTWIAPVFVDEGDIIATAVGSPGNTGMDFGLYDLRQKNKASKTSAWLNETDKSQAPYALCWLELLPEPDAAIVQRLPAGDGKNGEKSEYCG
ncbi:MAG TPA: hypothetical protein VJH23_02735 [archaeon]|nr:hypothetical protein [archaeon]